MRKLASLLFLLAFSAYAEAIDLSGIIVDQDNNGIPNVEVKLESSNQTTLTNTEGKWSIQVQSASIVDATQLEEIIQGSSINLNLETNTFVDLKILNNIGKIVQHPWSSKNLSGVHQLDLAQQDLSTGFYYYRLQIGHSVISGTFLKQSNQDFSLSKHRIVALQTISDKLYYSLQGQLITEDVIETYIDYIEKYLVIRNITGFASLSDRVQTKKAWAYFTGDQLAQAVIARLGWDDSDGSYSGKIYSVKPLEVYNYEVFVYLTDSLDQVTGKSPIKSFDSFFGDINSVAVFKEDNALPQIILADTLYASKGDSLELTPTVRDTLSFITTGGINYNKWDFDGDKSWDLTLGENPQTKFLFENFGSYQVHLKVQDDDNNTIIDSVTVILQNQMPQLNWISPTQDTSIGKGVSLDFEIQVFDTYGGKINQVKWDFKGDGIWDDSLSTTSADTNLIRSIMYDSTSASGDYPLIISVTDDDNNTLLDTLLVTLANNPPKLSLNLDSLNLTPIEPDSSVFLLTATDTLGGSITGIWVDWNHDDIYDDSVATSTARWEHTFTALGTHDIQFKTIDDDSNVVIIEQSITLGAGVNLSGEISKTDLSKWGGIEVKLLGTDYSDISDASGLWNIVGSDSLIRDDSNFEIGFFKSGKLFHKEVINKTRDTTLSSVFEEMNLIDALTVDSRVTSDSLIAYFYSQDDSVATYSSIDLLNVSKTGYTGSILVAASLTGSVNHKIQLIHYGNAGHKTGISAITAFNTASSNINIASLHVANAMPTLSAIQLTQHERQTQWGEPVHFEVTHFDSLEGQTTEFEYSIDNGVTWNTSVSDTVQFPVIAKDTLYHWSIRAYDTDSNFVYYDDSVEVIEDAATLELSSAASLQVNRAHNLNVKVFKRFNDISIEYFYNNQWNPTKHTVSAIDSSISVDSLFYAHTIQPLLQTIGQNTMTWKVRVTNNLGTLVEDSLTVNITNDNPTIQGLKDTVLFANSTDFSWITANDSDSYYFEIDYGDGTLDTANSIALHNYQAGDFQVYVTVKDSFGGSTLDSFNLTMVGNFTDGRDGKSYQYVRIGDQYWMANNLNYGTSFLSGHEESMLQNSVAEFYCLDDTQQNCSYTGALYQWPEALALNSSCLGSDCNSNVSWEHKGICPTGWVLPSDFDWALLEEHLGIAEDEQFTTGYRGSNQSLSLLSTSMWQSGNLHNNSTHFNALPSGLRYWDMTGGWGNDSTAAFISTSQSGTNSFWSREFGTTNRGQIKRSSSNKEDGYGVRCVKWVNDVPRIKLKAKYNFTVIQTDTLYMNEGESVELSAYFRANEGLTIDYIDWKLNSGAWKNAWNKDTTLTMTNLGMNTVILRGGDDGGHVVYDTLYLFVYDQLSSFTDARDGQSYNQITIGTQTWMAENLNYGNIAAPFVGHLQENIDKYCPNQSNTDCNSVGALYQWHQAMNVSSSCESAPCSFQIYEPHQGVCPVGWHIPSRAEFTTLYDYVETYGQDSVVHALRSTSGWANTGSYLNGSDEWKFGAKGVGYVLNTTASSGWGVSSTFWTMDEYNAYGAYQDGIDSSYGVYANVGKERAFAVRCVKN